MVSAIISFFNVFKNLFVGGGFFSKIFSWFGTGVGSLLGSLGWIGTLLTGGFAVVANVWAYVSAYFLVDVARKLLLITFIASILGWVFNYSVNDFLIFDGSSISTLFKSYIDSFASFGVLGNNLIAFLTKIGFFQCLGIYFTVVIYTTVARIALRILFN